MYTYIYIYMYRYVKKFVIQLALIQLPIISPLIPNISSQAEARLDFKPSSTARPPGRTQGRRGSPLPSASAGFCFAADIYLCIYGDYKGTQWIQNLVAWFSDQHCRRINGHSPKRCARAGYPGLTGPQICWCWWLAMWVGGQRKVTRWAQTASWRTTYLTMTSDFNPLAKTMKHGGSSMYNCIQYLTIRLTANFEWGYSKARITAGWLLVLSQWDLLCLGALSWCFLENGNPKNSRQWHIGSYWAEFIGPFQRGILVAFAATWLLLCFLLLAKPCRGWGKMGPWSIEIQLRGILEVQVLAASYEHQLDPLSHCGQHASVHEGDMWSANRHFGMPNLTLTRQIGVCNVCSAFLPKMHCKTRVTYFVFSIKIQRYQSYEIKQ